MASLENAVVGVAGPLVDPRLRKHVVILTTCDIPETIRKAMTTVLWAVAEQMEHDGISLEGRNSISCIFSDSRTFSIAIDPGQVAMCACIAFYPLPNLVQRQDPHTLFTVLAEELCHFIWDISGERTVCFKVHETLQRCFPGAPIELFYGAIPESD